MQNRITFSNVIGVLLENKKKTYAQYQMIEDIFYDCLCNMDLFEKDDFEKNITYSRWCTGDRPIPKEILSFYDNAGFDGIQNNIQDDVIPNLINVPATRELLLELVADSVDVIGTEKADEFAGITDDSELITVLIRYAILNDHDSKHTLLSPDLSDIMLSNRLPSANRYFTGRKEELKAIIKALQEHNPVFITGTAGMGKSELAKTYAKKNEKKYTNIIHLFYGGDLKKCIAHMEFSDDTADMSEEMLFDKHMRILKKLHSDSLIIIDNFNVLPKEDVFFKEFVKLNCKILVTSRCNISQYETIKISEMDANTKLVELFYKHCPSAKSSGDVVKEIIQTVGCHTLTVCLSALSLTASGLEPEELLAELKTCGLNIASGEDVELYKDDDFTDGLMIEHLRKLLQLGKLSNQQLDILRNLSLLPVSGVLKNSFKNWMTLDNLTDVNHLIKYGFINKDTDNKKMSLHPLLQEVIAIETIPTVTACCTMLDSLHLICLAHGLELRRPENIISSLISVSERIIDMMEGKPEPAEMNLLGAESIIGNAVGTDNDYMKTTYRYLNNLYARWKKPEKAIEYRDKYFNTNRITTNKNA